MMPFLRSLMMTYLMWLLLGLLLVWLGAEPKLSYIIE